MSNIHYLKDIVKSYKISEPFNGRNTPNTLDVYNSFSQKNIFMLFLQERFQNNTFFFHKDLICERKYNSNGLMINELTTEQNHFLKKMIIEGLKSGKNIYDITPHIAQYLKRILKRDYISYRILSVEISLYGYCTGLIPFSPCLLNDNEVQSVKNQFFGSRFETSHYTIPNEKIAFINLMGYVLNQEGASRSTQCNSSELHPKFINRFLNLLMYHEKNEGDIFNGSVKMFQENLTKYHHFFTDIFVDEKRHETSITNLMHLLYTYSQLLKKGECQKNYVPIYLIADMLRQTNSHFNTYFDMLCPGEASTDELLNFCTMCVRETFGDQIEEFELL